MLLMKSDLSTQIEFVFQIQNRMFRPQRELEPKCLIIKKQSCSKSGITFGDQYQEYGNRTTPSSALVAALERRALAGTSPTYRREREKWGTRCRNGSCFTPTPRDCLPVRAGADGGAGSADSVSWMRSFPQARVQRRGKERPHFSHRTREMRHPAPSSWYLWLTTAATRRAIRHT